jgi:predicted lactoylglutathione lyase
MTKALWINLPVEDVNKSKAFFTKLGFEQNLQYGVREDSASLFSIDAESVAEVDEMAKKVIDAGGTIYGDPGYKDGWMYGCGFIDLDGQRWSILYMDMSKMPLGD